MWNFTSRHTQNCSSINIASDFNQRLMMSFCPVSIFACVKFWGNRGNFRIVSICQHYFKESLPIHCHAALPCSHLALTPFGFKCEASTRGGGHRGQVQWVTPETRVQLLIPINERQQSAHLMGHQSYLNPRQELLSWFAYSGVAE